MLSNKLNRFRLMVVAVSSVIVLATTALAITQNPKKKRAKVPYAASSDHNAIQQAMDAASAPTRIRVTTYHGLIVKPSTEAKGQALAIQERIASQMSKNDFVPTERLDHFNWYAETYSARIIGWNAEIIEVTPQAKGYRVKTKVSFVGSNASITTNDHMIEYYDVDNAGIRHVGSEAPKDAPEVAIF